MVFWAKRYDRGCSPFATKPSDVMQFCWATFKPKD
jgi:hypothetical protein